MSKEELNLGDIPGLGPVRRAALAEAGIHDLEGLLRLKVAELAAIRGVGHWQARKIAEFLRQRGLVLEMEVAGGDPAVVIVPPETLDDVAAVAEAVDALKTQAALEAHLEAEVAQLEQVVAASQDGVQNDALTDEQTALVDSSTAIPVSYEQTVREVLARAAQPEVGSALNGSEGPHGAGPAAAGAGAPAPVSEEKETEVEEPREPVAPEGGAEGEESAPESETPEAEVPEAEAPEAEAPAAEAAADGAETEAAEALQERIREQRQQLPEAALELMEAIRAAAVNKQLTRQITRLLIIAGEFVNDARPLSAKQREAASEALDQAEESLRRAIEKRAFSAREQKELAARIRRRRKQLEQVLERE